MPEKTRPMRIAVISMIRENWGGSEELWAAMAEEALKQGHDLFHLSFEHSKVHDKTQRLIDKGLNELYRIGFSGNAEMSALKKKWIIAKNYFRKKINPPFKQLFGFSPDVVLYNGTCLSIANEKTFIEEIEKRNTRFFILSHFFSPLETHISPQQKEYTKRAYLIAEKCFFVDNKSKTATESFLGITLNNAVIVRNPVNMESVEYIPYPDNAIAQFACVGNLICAHKGQDILLDVLSTQGWKDRDWQLHIYGSGQDEYLLKEKVNNLFLNKKVFFHGKVKDIRAVWEKNQILVMPSRMEGMPLAVVEAVLCGRPTIATDVGGITEWVEDNKEGFIASIPSIDTLSTVMENAWQQRTNWESIGKNAHAKAIKCYDPTPGKTLLNLMIL